MNKRIAKKKYKKAVEIMKNPKAHGLAAVMIVNQACVDTNGQPCDSMENPNSRMILLKRPKIIYQSSLKNNMKSSLRFYRLLFFENNFFFSY